MGFLKNIFSGKTPEEHERSGDALCDAKQWGQARLAFAKALQKLDGRAFSDDVLKQRIEKKLSSATESLVQDHFDHALELMESDCLQEAGELLALAGELTKDDYAKERIGQTMSALEKKIERKREERRAEFYFDSLESGESEQDGILPGFENAAENFQALIGTLPEDVQAEYIGYGKNFISGYIALNHGAFDAAVGYLNEAMNENRDKKGYIPVELATAYFNLGQIDEARGLLENFLKDRPDALPAYEILFEIFWEQGDFEAADALLQSIPADKADTLAIHILKGETLFHKGEYEEADAHYSRFLKTYGWNETVARALAKTCEAYGRSEKARGLYREMMSRCGGCGQRIDPFVKKKFADLSFAAGERSSAILELYLSVAHENPEAAADCYEKAARICDGLGDENEAERFQALSSRLKNDQEIIDRPRGGF